MMKTEYVHPFVDSLAGVLEQYLPDLEPRRGEPVRSEGPIQNRGELIYIGLSGDLKGRVVFNMSRSTAVAVAEEMNGEEFSGMNDLVRSTIQELCNMVIGSAGQALENNREQSINITPPTMITGEDTKLSDSVKGQRLEVSLETKVGRIVINLAVQNSS